MKRALVTGGTGFLGNHLVKRLANDGWQVRSLDFRPPLKNDDRVEFLKKDIRSYDCLDKAAKECEVVFHLAAIPSIARAPYEAYHDINVQGTENVMKAAQNNGVRHVVHISSSTVYGIPAKCPLTEEDVIHNVGNYGKSKLKAENICRDYRTDDMTTSIIRPRVILGPGRIGIFSLLFDAILGNNRVFLIGDGSNLFQFTDINDMLDSMLLVAEKDQSATFNIGSTDKTPVRKVIEGLIAHAQSSSPITAIPSGLARTVLTVGTKLGISPLMNEQFMIADKDFMLDTSRAKERLGWEPTKKNVECLIDAFDWYKENMYGQKTQYQRFLGVFGKFRHSQQGAFQDSSKGMDI